MGIVPYNVAPFRVEELDLFPLCPILYSLGGGAAGGWLVTREPPAEIAGGAVTLYLPGKSQEQAPKTSIAKPP